MFRLLPLALVSFSLSMVAMEKQPERSLQQLSPLCWFNRNEMTIDLRGREFLYESVGQVFRKKGFWTHYLKINFSSSGLTKIPSELLTLLQKANTNKLRELNLRDNKLTSLPETLIALCRQIPTVDLRDNPLSASTRTALKQACDRDTMLLL
jgi:hypothetical protein